MSQKFCNRIDCAHPISVMGSEFGNYTSVTNSITKWKIAYTVGLCFSAFPSQSCFHPLYNFSSLKKCFLCLQDQNKDKKISWKIIHVLNFKLNVPRHRIGIEPLLKTLFQDGKFSVKSQRKQNQFSRERFMTVSNSFR